MSTDMCLTNLPKIVPTHTLLNLQAIPGVPPIRPGLNPATWVLDVTTPTAEQRLGVDFADLYARSDLYRCAR